MRLARLAAAWLGAGLLGLASGIAVAQDNVITIGAALSLSGKFAQNGVNTKNGYEIAVRRINQIGGVEVGGIRYRIEVRYYDDESRPARSTELAERLIRQDGVKFMLGPYSSSLTKAVLPLVERHQVPMVEANGAARELFTSGNRYLFAVLSTSDQYLAPAIDLAAAHAAQLGKSAESVRVALAMEDDPFAQDVRAGVLARVERHGMMVVIDDQLPPELDDMSVTLTKVKALKPDVLVVSGQEQGARTAVRQISAIEAYVPIVAMTHCDSARLADELGPAAEHVLCAHQWHQSLSYEDEIFGTAGDFARHFRETHDHDPPYQAAQSAAAIQVFADAFARAQSLDPKKVRDALASTELDTFYGPIKFDASGRNIAKPMLLTQIRDGKFVIVAPEAFATHEPVIPRPRE